MRYELRVLVGLLIAHRGWSKVYTALAVKSPPSKNVRNYNGFSASGSNILQKTTVFLPPTIRRVKTGRITLVVAPLLQTIYKNNGIAMVLVVLTRAGCIICFTWCEAWDQLNRFAHGWLLPAFNCCLLYTSPSPRDQRGSRMPSSA